MSRYLTLDGVREAYVAGEIGEEELEAEIERILDERRQRTELADVALCVALGGVVIRAIQQLDERDGGEK